MLKILVVDDEELIRLGLASKLRKAPFDIGEIAHASNAAEAWEAVQRRTPDIVLCDINMEGSDGLHLSRRVNARYPDVKIVIISGYHEFSYAQQAIQIGVVDYLLKPVDFASLVKALQTCVNRIDAEKQSNKALAIVERGMLQKRLQADALAYLEGRVQNPGELFEDYRPETSRFAAAYLYLDQSLSLFFDSFIGEVLERRPDAGASRNLLCFEYRRNEYLIAMCMNAPSDGETFEALLACMLEVLRGEHPRYAQSLYTVGVSEEGGDLRRAFSQAVTAMKHRVLSPKRERIDYGSLADHTVLYRLDPVRLSVLRSAAGKRDIRRMLGELDALGLELQEERYSYDSLQSVYFRLLILMEELSEKSPGMALNDYPREIYFFPSVADMLDFFRDALIEIVEMADGAAPSGDHRDKVIRQVKDYVGENYAQEISLKEIADRIHINYCYLSILFKGTTNINFRDYVTGVRIERAKELLADGYKVKDVAAFTGFSNQHYFSKAFKKITDLTPSEFRELRLT